MKVRVTLSALCMVVAVASCSDATLIEGASVIATDKTLADHAISFYSGKHCSSVRLERGLTYCVEDEKHLTPLVHCYSTLGEVTCYDRPSPYPGGQQELGSNDHNVPRR